MASISSPGIGSGLDIGNLVSQLVAAEGQVKSANLNRKEAGFQAVLSGIGTLKSALSEFNDSLNNLKTASFFSTRATTSADTELFTASATSDAVAGTYDVEVIQLAQASKSRSAGFAAATSVVGTGTLTIGTGVNSFNVSITSGSDTLEGIRNAINNATGNTSVTATIINVDNGVGGTESRLVLSSSSAGAANALTVTVDDDDLNDSNASGLSQLATVNLFEIDAAQDAIIEVDGQAVTRSSNTISDAIEGVTINLLSETATPGTTTELRIRLDTNTIKAEIEDFVEAYNSMITNFNKLTAFNPDSGQKGSLFGDTTMRGVLTQIRRELTSQVPGLSGAVTSLVDLGITTQSDDKLSIDAAKLDEAISDNLTAVTTLFSSSDGIANRLDSLIANYIDSDGVLNGRTDTLNNQIEDIADQREILQKRLAALERRLLNQFTALDTLVSQLNSTSTFLSQQLANLPGAISVNKKS